MLGIHIYLVLILILLIGINYNSKNDGYLVNADQENDLVKSERGVKKTEECIVDASGSSSNSCNSVAIEKDDEQENKMAEQEEAKEEEKKMKVLFINNWSGPVSLLWEEEATGYAHVVVNSIGVGKSQEMNTFIGHAFMFTVEGTRSRVGEYYIMEKGKEIYELPSTAKVVEQNLGDCVDRYPRRCQLEAKGGQCDKSPGWMTVNCPQSCNRCELLDSKKRCDRKFLNITEEPWMKPGDLHKLFEGMEERTKQYEPVVVSKPPKGPWIIYFDKFLSDEEVDALIKWGDFYGFQRSTDTGPRNARGEAQKIVSTQRTSENTWCRENCSSDPLVKGITNRIHEVTKTPITHYEEFQLLRYAEGQYYRVHHDMAPNEYMHYGGGPRTLTFFLYLSDVEEGGETHFPALQLKVAPKKGRAVLWPSVLDEDSYKQDPRTVHEALPVKKGKKYAANHWIHSNEYKISNLWGCGGAFD